MTLKKNITYNRSFPVFLSLIALLTLFSCKKDPVREITTTPPTAPISFKSGVFVINEGNFNWGNATVSFISKKTDSVFSDVFGKVNNSKLGDVAQEMKIFGSKGYILINNSNKVEVVSVSDFKSVKTISGFNSPRCIQLVNNKKAYVSNLLKDISIIDLNTMSVIKSIPTANWTEGMILHNNYMYVTAVGSYTDPNSERHPKILIIDTNSDEIVDSIKSGKEPLGIVIDKKNKVWVLCTGGYDGFEAPSLMRIDPDLRIVEKTYTFPTGYAIPSRLCMNSTQDTIYYLNNGIYKMAVTSQELPEKPFIAANGRLFYGLDIDPSDGSIYASDAVDYVQDGYVFHFKQSTGELLDSYKAGRIPAFFCFSSEEKK